MDMYLRLKQAIVHKILIFPFIILWKTSAMLSHEIGLCLRKSDLLFLSLIINKVTGGLTFLQYTEPVTRVRLRLEAFFSFSHFTNYTYRLWCLCYYQLIGSILCDNIP